MAPRENQRLPPRAVRTDWATRAGPQLLQAQVRGDRPSWPSQAALNL